MLRYKNVSARIKGANKELGNIFLSLTICQVCCGNSALKCVKKQLNHSQWVIPLAHCPPPPSCFWESPVSSAVWWKKQVLGMGESALKVVRGGGERQKKREPDIVPHYPELAECQPPGSARFYACFWLHEVTQSKHFLPSEPALMTSYVFICECPPIMHQALWAMCVLFCLKQGSRYRSMPSVSCGQSWDCAGSCLMMRLSRRWGCRPTKERGCKCFFSFMWGTQANW